jgi:hypothetical protein
VIRGSRICGPVAPTFHRDDVARRVGPVARPRRSYRRGAMLRRPVLYPVEPQAGRDGQLIGAPGFEPGTSCSQSRRATGLRHAP